MRTSPVAGLDLTAFTMGSAPLPTPVPNAVELLDEGWEAGIRGLDAADGTGGAESAAGRWLEERQPEGVVVLSGLGAVVGEDRGSDLSPATLDRQLAAGARRLGRIDLAWLRGSDARTPIEETLQPLAAAIEAGTLRGWGAGGADAWTLEALLSAADRAALPRPAFVRLRLNLLDRQALRDLAPLGAGEGVALLAAAPLGAGRLTDRYVAAEERAAEAVRFGAPPNTPVDPALDVLIALRTLARGVDASLEALALAWLLGTDAVASTVATPRSKADWDPVHEALDVELDAELRERLESVTP